MDWKGVLREGVVWGQNWPLPHFLLVWLVPKLNADAPLYAEPQVASAYPARE